MAILANEFSGNFVLWAGQTKLAGNRERVVSSGDLQMVDRSLLNSRFNIDRDIGLQLRHHFNLTDTFIVKEVFSISQGEGRNVTTGNLGGHQYTSRLEILPFGNFASKGDYRGSDLKFETSPKLAIGVTYDFNNNAVKNRSNQGSYMETDNGFYETNINTLFIDLMFTFKLFDEGNYVLTLCTLLSDVLKFFDYFCIILWKFLHNILGMLLCCMHQGIY